ASLGRLARDVTQVAFGLLVEVAAAVAEEDDFAGRGKAAFFGDHGDRAACLLADLALGVAAQFGFGRGDSAAAGRRGDLDRRVGVGRIGAPVIVDRFVVGADLIVRGVLTRRSSDLASLGRLARDVTQVALGLLVEVAAAVAEEDDFAGRAKA